MLEALRDVRGVRHVVLIDDSGKVVSSLGLDSWQEADQLALVAAGRAVIGSLQKNLVTASWHELLLDVEGGPVILVPFGTQILLTAFDEIASLGRVRFAIRRLMGSA